MSSIDGGATWFAGEVPPPFVGAAADQERRELRRRGGGEWQGVGEGSGGQSRGPGDRGQAAAAAGEDGMGAAVAAGEEMEGGSGTGEEMEAEGFGSLERPNPSGIERRRLGRDSGCRSGLGSFFFGRWARWHFSRKMGSL